MMDTWEELSTDALLDIIMDEDGIYGWAERDVARRIISRRDSEDGPTPTWKVVLRLNIGVPQAQALKLAKNLGTLGDVRLATVEQDLVHIGLCQSCMTRIDVPGFDPED